MITTTTPTTRTVKLRRVLQGGVHFIEADEEDGKGWEIKGYDGNTAPGWFSAVTCDAQIHSIRRQLEAHQITVIIEAPIERNTTPA